MNLATCSKCGQVCAKYILFREEKKNCNTPRERELKSSRLKTNKQTHMHWPNILQPSFFWRLQFATVRKSSLIWYLCCKLRGYLEGVKSITGAHTLVFNNAKSSFIRFDTYRYEHKNIIIIIIQIPFFIFIFFLTWTWIWIINSLQMNYLQLILFFLCFCLQLSQNIYKSLRYVYLFNRYVGRDMTVVGRLGLTCMPESSLSLIIIIIIIIAIIIIFITFRFITIFIINIITCVTSLCKQ